MVAGTPGVVVLHSIPKMCACVCHCICLNLPVFQGRFVCSSKRQLRVSLERPPGVFAPVVEQWGRKHKDSSCPQSVCIVFVIYLACFNVILLSDVYVHFFAFASNYSGHQLTLLCCHFNGNALLKIIDYIFSALANWTCKLNLLLMAHYIHYSLLRKLVFCEN